MIESSFYYKGDKINFSMEDVYKIHKSSNTSNYVWILRAYSWSYISEVIIRHRELVNKLNKND